MLCDKAAGIENTGAGMEYASLTFNLLYTRIFFSLCTLYMYKLVDRKIGVCNKLKRMKKCFKGRGGGQIFCLLLEQI